MKPHIHAAKERFDFLCWAHDKLAYRSDLKLVSWCGRTSRELSIVQKRVFGQIYGICNECGTLESQDILFRWLLAHMGRSRHDFNIQKTSPQWEKIMRYYFRSKGQYAELAIAERILLTALRGKTKTPITNIFPADRMADKLLATDWIYHQDMTKWRMQIGVQVETSNHIRAKLNTQARRDTHDQSFFWKNTPSVVQDFLRHNTAVMCFPLFAPSKELLERGKEDLTKGKRAYQSRLYKEESPDFSKYWRWVMDILDCLHRGIVDQSIRLYPHRKQSFSFLEETKEWNTLRVSLEEEAKRDIAFIDFYTNFHKKNTQHPISFAMPIGGDFLDIYRDMAGVRAR